MGSDLMRGTLPHLLKLFDIVFCPSLPLRIVGEIALHIFRVKIPVMSFSFVRPGMAAHFIFFFFPVCAALQWFRRSLSCYSGTYAGKIRARCLPGLLCLPFSRIQFKWILMRPGAVRRCLFTSRGCRKRPRSAALAADERQRPHMSADLREHPRQIIGCLQFSAFLPPCMCLPDEYINHLLSSLSYALELFAGSLFSCLHCSPWSRKYAAMYGT